MKVKVVDGSKSPFVRFFGNDLKLVVAPVSDDTIVLSTRTRRRWIKELEDAQNLDRVTVEFDDMVIALNDPAAGGETLCTLEGPLWRCSRPVGHTGPHCGYRIDNTLCDPHPIWIDAAVFSEEERIAATKDVGKSLETFCLARGPQWKCTRTVGHKGPHCSHKFNGTLCEDNPIWPVGYDYYSIVDSNW